MNTKTVKETVTSPARVTVTKLEGDGPHSKDFQGKPIVTGHKVKGYLSAVPKVGAPLCLLRTERNGVEALGIFQTSPITKMESARVFKSARVFTESGSVYLLELQEDEPSA